ncbi:hypothetical protein FRACA_580021 [Frankia canadensis]|uniref:Uncharacterized protein n=1 Tax=Frankia canadensis TaxID=1836972 RepID=A0A2I2KZ97_9ACTN|nr:hypothetical protein FRACA_580021 [Frankia canadensis]SOU58260.1 hypothetical protein FRACA_580021 [Frankia canadensis]
MFTEDMSGIRGSRGVGYAVIARGGAVRPGGAHNTSAAGGVVRGHRALSPRSAVSPRSSVGIVLGSDIVIGTGIAPAVVSDVARLRPITARDKHGSTGRDGLPAAGGHHG